MAIEYGLARCGIRSDVFPMRNHLQYHAPTPLRGRLPIKLDNLRYDVYGSTGEWTRNPNGGFMRKRGPASVHQERKRVERAATQRSELTSEFREQVAEVALGRSRRRANCRGSCCGRVNWAEACRRSCPKRNDATAR